MESSDSLGSHGVSRETLARGGEILSNIASLGVVKEETPEDEKELLAQMEALIPEPWNTNLPKSPKHHFWAGTEEEDVPDPDRSPGQ